MTTQFESELAEAQARSFFKQGDFAKADNFSIKALKANPNNRGAQLIAIKISGELSGSLQDKSFEDLIQSVTKISLYGLHTLSKRFDLIQQYRIGGPSLYRVRRYWGS